MADAASAGGGTPRTLIGGVGYHHLRDFSLGPLVVERLRRQAWPATVELEDLSYDPVRVVHRLAGEEPPFARLVVLGSARRGRRSGAVTAYRWDRSLPGPDEVQERVSEAVTGVISLDNLLVVVEAFGGAPEEIYAVEVEPEIEAMGEELSPSVAAAAERAAEIARQIALHPARRPAAPTAPLGGGARANGHDATPRVTPLDPPSAGGGPRGGRGAPGEGPAGGGPS